MDAPAVPPGWTRKRRETPMGHFHYWYHATHAPAGKDADGHWTAPYVRLRFVARRPGTPRFATTP